MGARRLLVSPRGGARHGPARRARSRRPPRPTPTSPRAAPADGASLAAAPRTIELRFTEHVVLEATEITVTEPDGHQVALSGLSLVESDEDQEAPVDRRRAGADAGRRRLPRVVAHPVERRPPQVHRHLRLRRPERGAGGRPERDEPRPLRARRPVGGPRRSGRRSRCRRRGPSPAPAPRRHGAYAAGLAAPSGRPAPRGRDGRRARRRPRRPGPVRVRAPSRRATSCAGACASSPCWVPRLALGRRPGGASWRPRRHRSARSEPDCSR